MGERLNGFTIVEIWETVGEHHISESLATHLLALSAADAGSATKEDLVGEHPHNLPTASENVL